MKELSNNLKKARDGAGLKKADVARKINTTRSNITRWENGTLPRIESLAKLYHVSLDHLVVRRKKRKK
jgi:transcriptional regulator with XRE-family HTH domain